jgi:hypothetical protein
MVRRFTKKGTPYHEPPYSWKELDELYARMGNIVGMTRRASPAAPPAEPAPARQRPPAAKPSPSPKRRADGSWGEFKQLDDGTLGLFADNGRDTGISVADLRAEGFGFVVHWNNDTWGEAKTLAEAKRIARSII